MAEAKCSPEVIDINSPDNSTNLNASVVWLSDHPPPIKKPRPSVEIDECADAVPSTSGKDGSSPLRSSAVPAVPVARRKPLRVIDTVNPPIMPLTFQALEAEDELGACGGAPASTATENRNRLDKPTHKKHRMTVEDMDSSVQFQPPQRLQPEPEPSAPVATNVVRPVRVTHADFIQHRSVKPTHKKHRMTVEDMDSSVQFQPPEHRQAEPDPSGPVATSAAGPVGVTLAKLISHEEQQPEPSQGILSARRKFYFGRSSSDAQGLNRVKPAPKSVKLAVSTAPASAPAPDPALLPEDRTSIAQRMVIATTSTGLHPGSVTLIRSASHRQGHNFWGGPKGFFRGKVTTVVANPAAPKVNRLVGFNDRRIVDVQPAQIHRIPPDNPPAVERIPRPPAATVTARPRDLSPSLDDPIPGFLPIAPLRRSTMEVAPQQPRAPIPPPPPIRNLIPNAPVTNSVPSASIRNPIPNARIPNPPPMPNAPITNSLPSASIRNPMPNAPIPNPPPMPNAPNWNPLPVRSAPIPDPPPMPNASSSACRPFAEPTFSSNANLHTANARAVSNIDTEDNFSASGVQRGAVMMDEETQRSDAESRFRIDEARRKQAILMSIKRQAAARQKYAEERRIEAEIAGIEYGRRLFAEPEDRFWGEGIGERQEGFDGSSNSSTNKTQLDNLLNPSFIFNPPPRALNPPPRALNPIPRAPTSPPYRPALRFDDCFNADPLPLLPDEPDVPDLFAQEDIATTANMSDAEFDAYLARIYNRDEGNTAGVSPANRVTVAGASANDVPVSYGPDFVVSASTLRNAAVGNHTAGRGGHSVCSHGPIHLHSRFPGSNRERLLSALSAMREGQVVNAVTQARPNFFPGVVPVPPPLPGSVPLKPTVQGSCGAQAASASPVGAVKEEPSCPICFDSFEMVKNDPSRGLYSTTCGHIFCKSCLMDTVTASHRCPTCRQKLSQKHIHPIYFG